MQPNEVLTEGFSLWLDEPAGRFRPAVPPHPLPTSIRSFYTIQDWLEKISQRIPISDKAHRRKQAVTDMSPLGLVEGPRDNPTLTQFGETVLHQWEDLGLTLNSDVHEIARCAALVRSGLNWSDHKIRAWYGQQYNAWERLRTLPSPDYWICNDLHRLILPYFLAKEDSRGYAPLSVFVALNGGKIGETSNWYAWADEDWSGANNLKILLDYITKTYRVGGSLNFRRALEVVHAARYHDESLPQLLNEWKISA